MTSYQKLKAENSKLKKQLDIVCNEDGIDSYNIKMQYKIKRKFEKGIWFGGGNVNQVIFNGIIPQINDKHTS